jgi:hypothetical protein
MFNISDKVFLARWEQSKVFDVCPDCQGQRFLTVIMGDGSHLSITCDLCAQYHGKVTRYVYQAKVEEGIITGIEINYDGDIQYRFNGSYIYKSDRLFADLASAEAGAVRLALEEEALQAKQLQRKEKDGKTWAWHVRYHREGVRKAEKDLAYHTSKLTVARAKVDKADEGQTT